jgi:hypothetical protein
VKKTRPVPVSPSDRFEPRLRAYSALGSAALAAVGVASSATAQIVTTTMTPSLVLSGATDSHDVGFVFGPASFNFHGSRTANMAGPTFIKGHLTVQGINAGVAAGDGTLRRVAYGTEVKAGVGLGGLQFGGNGFAFRTHDNNTLARYGYFPFGNFVPPHFLATADPQLTKTGYVGFKRVQEGHTYYGWLHITVSGADGRPTSIALTPGPNTGYVTGAYIDRLNGTITAGQVSAIPEPASVATGLALFALGAAGVREHRRRKLAA